MLPRNTLLLSSSTPLFFYLPPSPSPFSPLSSSLCISYSFPPSISTPLSFLPSFYFASLLFPLLHAFSLNPTLHDTSYSSAFLSVFFPPTLLCSLSLPLSLSPSPPSLCFLYYTYNKVLKCYHNCP